MLQVKAKLIYNKKLAHDYFHCALEAASIAKNALPGQFVNIKISQTADPLLRRPFSIHRVRGKTVEILYEVVGKGSAILSEKKAGEYLDIIGPLGKGFDYWSQSHKVTKLSIIVAGGMGVAPLLFLAENITKGTPNTEHRTPIILIGAKAKKQLLCAEEFKKLGCEVKIATDDGSCGFKGYVCELLKNSLSTIDYRLSTIYACGPKSMLKAVADIAKIYKIPAQISLEEHMACGIGVCLGCVANTKEGYKRVCQEGPVFDAQEIIWED